MSSRRAVKEQYVVDYDMFLNHPEPLKLIAELAILRTTLVEYQQSRTILHTLKKQMLARTAAKEIEKRAEKNDGEITSEEMYDIICAHLCQDNTMITGEDVKAISTLVDGISKVAERAKRIEDGLTLRISWDQDMVQIITNFIALVALRFVPVSHRPALAAATRDFMQGKGAVAQSLSLASAFSKGDVYEG